MKAAKTILLLLWSLLVLIGGHASASFMRGAENRVWEIWGERLAVTPGKELQALERQRENSQERFKLTLGCVEARYYDPVSGRFLSPDPLGHGSDLSLYAYCNGDPVNGLDPDGRLASQYSDVAQAARIAGRAGYEIQRNYQAGHAEYTADWQIVDSAKGNELLAEALESHGVQNVRDSQFSLNSDFYLQAIQYYQNYEIQRAQDIEKAYPWKKYVDSVLSDRKIQVMAAVWSLGELGFAGFAETGGGTAAETTAPRLADDVATLKSIRRYTERLVQGKVSSSNPATMLEVRDIQAAIANRNFRGAGTGFHELNFRLAEDAQGRGFLQNLNIDQPIATPGGFLNSRRPDYLFDGGGIYDIKPFRPSASAYDTTRQFLDIQGATGSCRFRSITNYGDC